MNEWTGSVVSFIEEMLGMGHDEYTQGWKINLLIRISDTPQSPLCPDHTMIKIRDYDLYWDVVGSAYGVLSDWIVNHPDQKDVSMREYLSWHPEQKKPSPFMARLGPPILPPTRMETMGLGSREHFEALLPKAPIDKEPDYQFVLMLAKIRSVCDPHEQRIYGYQFDRLATILSDTIPGYRKATEKYRLDSVEDIDGILKRARLAVQDDIPKLKAVDDGKVTES